MNKYNFWYFSSFVIALIVALPIITVFISFFSETSNYFTILKRLFPNIPTKKKNTIVDLY